MTFTKLSWQDRFAFGVALSYAIHAVDDELFADFLELYLEPKGNTDKDSKTEESL